MMRVAVVGGGISGLEAAYVVAKDGAKVVLYEKEDSLGGHAKTLAVDGNSLDLGFMVLSQVACADMMELFEGLGVDMELSDISSFSVSLDSGQGWEWRTYNGLSSLFAQKKNILNPCFWKIIREITKLKNDASNYVEKIENNADVDRNETLGHFLQSRGYSELFQKAFLIPTCATIWSCSSEVMSFSAYSVLSFLRTHHILELFGCPQRLTPRWRSQSFITRIKEELESRSCQIRTNSEIYSVLTNDKGCVIMCEDGSEEVYDGCIVATHALDALKMLGKQETDDESRILGAFQYAHSDIFVHHDDNLMPQNQAAWRSKNFLGTNSNKACITYWLNIVQNINDSRLPFFLTINPPHTPKSTLFKWSTSHPILSISASKASSELNLIQGKRQIWFCGAYQGYGFLEDGVKAGILVGKSLRRKSYTVQNNPKCMVRSWLETGASFIVTRFLERFIATGCLILLEEGGRVFTFEGTREKSTIRVSLRVHNPQFYWKVAAEGDLGFADAYINGDFSFVDKNEGLLNFFLMFIANTVLHIYTQKLSKRRGWWTPWFYTSSIASAKYFFKHVSRRNTLNQTRQNISEHYDLTPDEDLRNAQLRKIHTLIKKARISKEHHILEIGCGWGSLAFEVVKITGCKYTGITLSKKQMQYVELKVKEAGLQDQIKLILCDYRELPESCKYDRIISCGMIESVGHEFMEEFFKCCESALAKNGLLVLQFISMVDEKYDEYRLSTDFIKEYIFPGGCVPSLSQVISAMAAASRLSVVHLEEIGSHYFYTLRCWRENLLKNQSQILALGFDEKFIRTWEYYFNYCAAGFKYCTLGDYQIVFSRPGDVAAFGNDLYNAVPSTC
ncbi:Cyclopropane-fatty-acyl-phospholipid synthase [Handroanthus impetiginosus]|uniref:Cyclopropane-fatty-acyl-phospholipid synthase n=1 Tax=Handroanthus impetiginosus TaxID=429701 RepID=A0A2G9I6A9_9LAMI|nr:Cyclopropane-fatty-acyl-phospholipid synthase [Handroanthus impetiginosus]